MGATQANNAATDAGALLLMRGRSAHQKAYFYIISNDYK